MLNKILLNINTDTIFLTCIFYEKPYTRKYNFVKFYNLITPHLDDRFV